jgi:hypothetical protein
LDDERAAMEHAINADNAGLLLPRRRKRPFKAQEALVRVTDLAPNIFAWTRQFWASQPARSNGGIYLIVNEIRPIPGKLRGNDHHLVNVRLQASHPLAKPMLSGLSHL